MKSKDVKNWILKGIISLSSSYLFFSLFLHQSPLDIITSYKWYIFTFLVILVFILVRLMKGDSIDKKAISSSKLEDTKFLSFKDLSKLKTFHVANLLKDKFSSGFVIGAKKVRGDVKVALSDELHMLAVGTTGSGKTTGLVDEMIVVNSLSTDRPSFIISDPKKELLSRHYSSLVERGYRVEVLDLRKPFESLRYNPFTRVMKKIVYLKEIRGEIKEIDGEYVVGNHTFSRMRDIQVERLRLSDEIGEDIKNIVYEICPIKNKEQPNWEEGARNLIYSLALAISEDILSGKVDLTKLNFYTIYQNISMYAREDTSILTEYLINSRDKFSIVPSLASGVLVTSDKTLTSYLSEVNSYMQVMSDTGVLSLTTSSDIDISSYDDIPTALFIVIPDELKNRHSFATLFIAESYKELVEKANNKGGKLSRDVYYILDEFGNLPRLSLIDSMVTVSRSRGIKFLFILQSLSQLVARYGKDNADTIKTNANIKMFIGSDDYETRRAFSELCGEKKVITKSYQTGGNNSTSSTSVISKPVISPSELERINGETKGDVYVSVRGYNPIKLVITPSYELKDIYFIGDSEFSTLDKDIVNLKDYFFDINLDNTQSRQSPEVNTKKTEDNVDPIKEEEIDEVVEQKDLISGSVDSEVKEYEELKENRATEEQSVNEMVVENNTSTTDDANIPNTDCTTNEGSTSRERSEVDILRQELKEMVYGFSKYLYIWDRNDLRSTVLRLIIPKIQAIKVVYPRHDVIISEFTIAFEERYKRYIELGGDGDV